MTNETRPGPATWAEAFPWLANHVNPWSDWSDHVDPTDERKLLLVVEVALEYQSTWKLGNLFPLVSGDTHIATLQINTRLANAFARRGLRTIGDTLSLSVPELQTLPAVGALSVQQFLMLLAKWNSIAALSSPELEPDATSSTPLVESSRATLSDLQLDALLLLAQWRIITNSGSVPLLSRPDEPLPERVANAVGVLEDLTPDAWLSEHQRPYSASMLIDWEISSLSERDRLIAISRILATSPMTLDDLGSKLGITRERVRQLESKLMQRVSEWVGPDHEVGLHAAAVRNQIGGLARLDHVRAALPELDEIVTSLNEPTWHVLDKLDDLFESDGEWIAAPSLASAVSHTHLTFDETSAGPGVADAEQFTNALREKWHALDRESLDTWLVGLGYQELDGFYLSFELKSLPDRAAAFLFVQGAPRTTDEILDGLGNDRSINSLKNAMAADDRFVRSNIKMWSLREWGVKEYRSIRESISDVLAGLGEVSIDTLIEELTSNFDVSPRSVLAYANSWPFELENGIVREARVPREARKSFSQTRNLYHTPSGVALRLTVTSDHLRGSGSAMPSTLASYLGLVPGERLALAFGSDEVTISWKTFQPSFGSIRRLVTSIDSNIGDEIMIHIADGTITALPITASTGSPDNRLRALTALPRAAETFASEVAHAIGIAENSTWSSVIQTLRERGETDTAGVTIELVGPNPAFELDPSATRRSKFRIVSIDDAD